MYSKKSLGTTRTTKETLFFAKEHTPGSALSDKQLPLGDGVVVLAENARQLLEYLELVARHSAPGLLEPVDRVALQARHDRLERGKVLEYTELLGNVDPGRDDPAADRVLGVGVDEDGADDTVTKQ